MLQRRSRLVREAVGGKLAVPDADLLEALGTPDVAVHADRAEIEGGHAECLCADLAVPAVEAAEEQVRVAIGQPARLDRMGIIDQEQEHVAVASIERGGVLGHLDMRVMGHGRPVEQPRHLPARVAGAVAGDPHDGLDQLMVPDPAIVGAGHRTQLGPPVLGLQRLHQLAAMREQPVLEIDAGKRRGELAQIARWRADEAGELPERPMGRRDRFVTAGHDQRQALGIVAARLDPHLARLDRPGGGALRPRQGCGVQLAQREISLVIGAREPFGRDAPDAPAPRDIDLVGRSTRRRRGGMVEDSGHGNSPRRAPGDSLPALTRHGRTAALFLSPERCGAERPRKGYGQTRLAVTGRPSPFGSLWRKSAAMICGSRPWPRAFACRKVRWHFRNQDDTRPENRSLRIW